MSFPLPAGGASYWLAGPAVWAVLAAADLEGEVRELLAEATAWYKKKGGALVLQVRVAVGHGGGGGDAIVSADAHKP